MSLAILDVGDEPLCDGGVAHGLGALGDDGLHDEDVGTLVVAAHVVDLAHLAAGQHHDPRQ